MTAGPPADDRSVLAAFIEGKPAGHSDMLHVEEQALVAGGDVAVALRLAPGVVLVRADVPDGLTGARSEVEEALRARSWELFDEETLLAAPIAMQVLGLRVSSWDLWGCNVDEAFAVLRRCAVGEQALPPIWEGGE